MSPCSLQTRNEISKQILPPVSQNRLGGRGGVYPNLPTKLPGVRARNNLILNFIRICVSQIKLQSYWNLKLQYIDFTVNSSL
jgi:hypothetical protein